MTLRRTPIFASAFAAIAPDEETGRTYQTFPL
jgi:hypothetical protein